MPEQILEKFCKHCETTHPVDAFPFRYETRKDGTRARASVCLTGRRARNREIYLSSDLDVRRAKVRECHARTTEKRLAYNQNYAKEHKAEQDAYFREWRQKKQAEGYFRTPHAKARARNWRLESKLKVFAAYGGARCACCQDETMEFLTLDHMDGNGGDHRKSFRGDHSSGTQIIRQLIAENFPPGYQILCFSCNVGKHRSGVNRCPHQLEVSALWKSFIDYATVPKAA